MDNKLCFADEYIVKVIMYDTLGKKLSSFFPKMRIEFMRIFLTNR